MVLALLAHREPTNQPPMRKASHPVRLVQRERIQAIWGVLLRVLHAQQENTPTCLAQQHAIIVLQILTRPQKAR